MSVKQLMLAEKKIRVLSLMQQKILVESSKVTSASIDSSASDVAATDVKWLQDFFVQNAVDDLNLLSIVDANVTYFVSGYIARSICRRRKCLGCRTQLLAHEEREERIEEFIPDEYMALFNDADRGPSEHAHMGTTWVFGWQMGNGDLRGPICWGPSGLSLGLNELL